MSKQDRKSRIESDLNRIDEVAGIINSLEVDLKKLKTERKYLEYILVGSQLIEFLLRRMLVVYSHAVNRTLLVNEQTVGSEIPLEVRPKFKKDSEGGLGSLLDMLENVYHCHDVDLITMVRDLKAERDEIAHKIIDGYKGNPSTLHSHLEKYVQLHMDEPIERIFKKIFELQEKITKDGVLRGSIDVAKIK